MLKQRNNFQIISKLLRRGHVDGVRRLIKNHHAADIAEIFRHLRVPQQQAVFSLIESLSVKAETLGELDDEVARELLPSIEDAEMIPLLRVMSGDDAADLLKLLPEERAEALLQTLRSAGEETVAALFDYDPESAAGIMTPEFFALSERTTAEEAIKRLQSHGDELEITYYLYITNDADQLVGVVSLRQLVLSSPDRELSDIMEPDIVRVTIDMDQEDVAGIVARYNLLAVPVVDHTNRMVGVVTVDDIIDVIRIEATEDILKMAGAGEQLEHRGPIRAAKARLPWLMASFMGGVMAAVLIGVYEESIAKVVPLAAFIPIILGMGGNVGIQSATIVTRGLALGKIDTSEIVQVVRHELIVSVICGVLYGLLLGGVAWIGYMEDDTLNSLTLGVVVGISVAAAMIIAATIGGAIPMLLARLNIDPALASGPFVTTSVDVFGILSYFSVAVFLLDI